MCWGMCVCVRARARSCMCVDNGCTSHVFIPTILQRHGVCVVVGVCVCVTGCGVGGGVDVGVGVAFHIEFGC